MEMKGEGMLQHLAQCHHVVRSQEQHPYYYHNSCLTASHSGEVVQAQATYRCGQGHSAD